MNCDLVFDILTRGPFPQTRTAQASAPQCGMPEVCEVSDESVERHLSACHECRTLAEALRPATALFHEALCEENSCLPSYHGKVASVAAMEPPIVANAVANTVASTVVSQAISNQIPASSAIWKFALAGVLGILLGVSIQAGAKRPWSAASSGEQASSSNSVAVSALPSHRFNSSHSPTKQGARLLISLSLPTICLTSSSTEDNASLDCCTKCHAAARAEKRPPGVTPILLASCQACHSQ